MLFAETLIVLMYHIAARASQDSLLRHTFDEAPTGGLPAGRVNQSQATGHPNADHLAVTATVQSRKATLEKSEDNRSAQPD